MDLPPVLAASAAPDRPRSGNLRFHGRARDCLSKGGLVGFLCILTVVGIPYAGLLFYRWLVTSTAIEHAPTATETAE
jgi:hypothetical protein